MNRRKRKISKTIIYFRKQIKQDVYKRQLLYQNRVRIGGPLPNIFCKQIESKPYAVTASPHPMQR